MTGNVHHTIAQHTARKNAYGGNDDQRFKPGRLRADGRIEEVDRVVAHTYIEVESSKNEKEYHYSEKHEIHNLGFVWYMFSPQK